MTLLSPNQVHLSHNILTQSSDLKFINIYIYIYIYIYRVQNFNLETLFLGFSPKKKKTISIIGIDLVTLNT